MSARLDELIASARERRDLDAVWDVDRSERSREGVLRRRDVRSRRDRALRRGALVAGGAGLLVLALLRAASSAPPPAQPEPVATASDSVQAPGPERVAEPLALGAMGDAGYARD